MLTLMKLKLYAIVPCCNPIVSVALTINLGSFSTVSFIRISHLITVWKGVSTLLMENFFLHIWNIHSDFVLQKRDLYGNQKYSKHCPVYSEMYIFRFCDSFKLSLPIV